MEQNGEGVKQLKEVLRRYRSTRTKGVTLDERPGCVYGMLTREQLDDLEGQLEQLSGTLNRIWISLLVMLVGLVLNILLDQLGVL